MAWKFDGRFLVAPSGERWNARSGGLLGNNPNVTYRSDGRSAALPGGTYRIVREQATGVSRKEMLIPGRNWGWWVPLEPLFETERGTAARGRFGVHPDGDLPGTDGCIGIYGENPNAYDRLYEMLKDNSTGSHLIVELPGRH